MKICRKMMVGTCLLFGVQALSWGFGFEDVAQQARTLAGTPYQAPESNLPEPFRKMTFGDYQQIQFRHEAPYWQDLKTSFKLEFYHQGMQFNTPVLIHEVIGDNVQDIPYNPDFFTFGSVAHDPDSVKGLGYAGFKVRYPINDPDKYDEILSVLGASYFRVLGKGQVYGLSARGLAIDTALDNGAAEEFPNFREFWIVRPGAATDHLVIYALLDSPSLTGAYQLVLYPDRDGAAEMDVHSRLFSRRKVRLLGIAPLTSMFLFGSQQPSEQLNFRDELHDSNGLGIRTGDGEWLWRPLNNPQHLSVSAFQVTNPRGFGLLQRGRDFNLYEDLDDRYDLRPSGWVEPVGDWGAGHVQLVEIPTDTETTDNIVAFWNPDRQPVPGEPLDLSYKLYFSLDEIPFRPQHLGYVKRTMRSFGEVRQPDLVRKPDGTTSFLIDFAGESLERLPETADVQPHISIGGNGSFKRTELRYNPVTHGWRLTLQVQVKNPSKPTEMRADLTLNGKILTETWTYQLPATK